MKNYSLLLFAALIVAIVAGCKGKEGQLVGKWNGPNGTVVMLNADKTFTQVKAGSTVEAAGASGTWSYGDKKLTVSITKIMGKSVDEFIDGLVKSMAKFNPSGSTPAALADAKKKMSAIDFTVSDDFKTLTPTDTTVAGKGNLTKAEG